MGFDNGTLQSSVYFQAKQFGSILRGTGPPVPQAGLVGDLYLDILTFNLFEKRATDAGQDVDPWGHFLFVVPVTYQTQLKWFSTSLPDDSIGVTGDYCLSWAGFGNYGLQLSIYGPKNASGSWPESGNGPTTTISAVGAGFVFPIGLSDEGTQISYSRSTQLIVAGLIDEYILAKPVPHIVGTPIRELGLQSTPTPVTVALNALYTAEDSRAI
jgi:hypothetical protein